VSAPTGRPARWKAGFYLLLVLDAVAVWFLIAVVAVGYNTESVEQPNVGFPILAAVAAASLVAGAVGAGSGRSRALVMGLLLVPLLAVVVALFLPDDTAA